MDSNCSTSGSEGFWTCTESLGFESSDERVGGEGGGQQAVVGERRDEAAWGGRPPLRRKKRADVIFPPPLPGLDWSGRSKTVLRAERGDGRLRLTEFKVGRPDTLHACREGGRLKLHLVGGAGDSALVDDEEDIEEEGGAMMVRRLVPAVRWWHEESGVAAAAPPRGISLFGALAA